MQDLYIGGTGTTADRSSSRANLAAAAAPSSPATAANGASASCLEQTDVSTLESRWLYMEGGFLSKKRIQGMTALKRGT
jgi:hypothetical protein